MDMRSTISRSRVSLFVVSLLTGVGCGAQSDATSDVAVSAIKGQGGQAFPSAPGFTFTGSMGTARAEHTATLLPNGGVLIVGGYSGSTGDLSTAEIYDPKAGTFSPTGSMSTPRRDHTATLLPNGKVLIVGGFKFSGGFAVLDDAELYDPATGTFTGTDSMTVPRHRHTATLLPDQRVLIAGGRTGTTTNSSAEVYDPGAGTFSPTGAMGTTRQGHSATLLPNGKTLIAGGESNAASSLSSAELYDPATGTFATTGSMRDARAGHSGSLFGRGKVLIAGGRFGAHPAELYDMKTGTFTTTGSMSNAGMGHTATTMAGQVLLTGGEGILEHFLAVGTVPRAEVYRSGVFAEMSPMNRGRARHTATLLGNGQVLIAGGIDPGSPLSSAELFQSSVKPCVAGATGCRWRDGDVITFGQHDWGAGAAAGLLQSGFSAVYLYPLGDPRTAASVV
jgi:hypothetical protein